MDIFIISIVWLLHNIYVYQIIKLYIINIYNCICQLQLNKANYKIKKKNHLEWERGELVSYPKEDYSKEKSESKGSEVDVGLVCSRFSRKAEWVREKVAGDEVRGNTGTPLIL